MNQQHKELKKARMTRYFIEAVNELTKSKPIESITLRDVASNAGFNSATLYHYFRNMEQVIAFSILDTISEIWIEASAAIIKDNNPINQYLTLWKAQCHHSFNLPNLFIYFYMLEDKSKVYAAANDYFAVFPERFELLAPVYQDLMSETNFEKKNKEYLSPCVEAGYFKAEDIASIMEMADILFGGILLQVLKHQACPENKKNSTHSFFLLLDGLLTPYFLKDSSSISDFISQMEVQ